MLIIVCLREHTPLDELLVESLAKTTTSEGDAMNDKTTGRIHWSFWAIGVIALIWNLMGAINFFMQMNPELLDFYRESERALIEGRPVWATAGFALAVFGGVLGSALLLLKRSVAFYVFIASLLGVIIAMIHALSADIDFGLGESIGVILMPLVVAAFLIWYSKRVESKGWIR